MESGFVLKSSMATDSRIIWGLTIICFSPVVMWATINVPADHALPQVARISLPDDRPNSV
jgi:hypothetical protein